MVRAAALVLALGSCGSHAGAATYRLAVGWNGSLPSLHGPCDAASLGTGGVLEPSAPGVFVARRAGTVDIRCRDGKLRLVVRQPTRIDIDPIDALRANGTYVLSARVADAEGELAVGDADIEWTLPPRLRRVDRCEHMLGTCLSSAHVRVVADAPGDVQVRARYGALERSAQLHIE